MSDLTAQLRLQYGLPPREPTFEIVLSELDAKDSRPIQVKTETVFNWNWSEEEFRAFYKDKEILKVLENGQQIVRVYIAPGTDVNLFATRRPVAIDAQYYANLDFRFTVTRSGATNNVWSQFTRAKTRFEDITKIPGVTLTQIAPPRMAPPTTERLSDGEDLVTEHIRFENARVVYQRFSYADQGFQQLALTGFINAEGNEIAPPVYVAALGAFVLTEPGYGEALISYPVKYQRWRVNYGIGAGEEFKYAQLAWLRGDITQFEMPHVMVLANAVPYRRLALTEFEPRVEPRGAYLGSWSFTGYEQASNPATSNLQTESASDRVTRTLTVGDVQVDVEDKVTVRMQDENGRIRTYRYLP